MCRGFGVLLSGPVRAGRISEGSAGVVEERIEGLGMESYRLGFQVQGAQLQFVGAALGILACAFILRRGVFRVFGLLGSPVVPLSPFFLVMGSLIKWPTPKKGCPCHHKYGYWATKA